MPRKKTGMLWTKVLELMRNKGGRVELTDPDLENLLGRTMYRISTYMWYIRTQAQVEVRAIRNGRKVVAYELAAVQAPAGRAVVSRTNGPAAAPLFGIPLSPGSPDRVNGQPQGFHGRHSGRISNRPESHLGGNGKNGCGHVR
jgi:hypothetical protein